MASIKLTLFKVILKFCTTKKLFIYSINFNSQRLQIFTNIHAHLHSPYVCVTNFSYLHVDLGYSTSRADGKSLASWASVVTLSITTKKKQPTFTLAARTLILVPILYLLISRYFYLNYIKL